ncbi:MAG: ATPase, partial [Bacteroidetes bacterium]|nr:ATPase [Bacteroidota bacterium]
MDHIPQLIRKLPARYDYPGCWQFIDVKGKALYGPKFRLYPEDAEVVARLMVWALRDSEGAQRLNLNLRKGIMLAGPVGTGKTSLMNLIRYILPAPSRHLMRSCQQIAFDFATGGYPQVIMYSKGSFFAGSETPVSVCFDDLGLEATLQHYGNSCNTMAEILLSRYDYFISHGMLSHITTNLSSQQIEERYGIRVRSRMRELFNRITFGQD